MTNLFNIFRPYSPWQVAIEWLMIGFVVYWVVRFLRGTRGAPLLKALVFLLTILYVVVGIFGQATGLERISFLYNKLLLIASFAVVMVFQPELRRALMNLGETSIGRGR